MYSSLLFYPFLFPFFLSDFIALCQLFIYFYKSALAFFSTRLHYVHSMLGFRLAWWCFNDVWVNFVNDMMGLQLVWVHKVYHITKVFSKKVTFSNKWSLNSPFSCYTHSMLGLRLDWQCFNKVWVNFVNPILSLRLAWLHKVYHKTQNFQKKRK